MPYTPVTASVYFAAYEGAYAGMAASGRVPLSAAPSSDAPWATLAGAYAQALDTQWGLVPATTSDVENIRGCSAGVWSERTPVPSNATDGAAFYAPIVAGVIALVQEAAIYNSGITPPSGGGGLAGFVIWRPGLPSGGAFVATETEVRAIVNAAGGAATVYVDSSLAPVLLTGSLDGQSRMILAAARGPVGGTPMRLTVVDGGQIQRIAGVSGQLEVFAEPTGLVPPLLQDNTNVGLFLSNGASLKLGPAATRAFVDVAAGGANIVAFRLDFSSRFSKPVGAVPFVNLLAAGAAFSVFYTGINPFNQPQGDTVYGPVGSFHVIVYDDSINAIPDQPNMLGTYTSFPIDTGAGLSASVAFNLAQLQALGPGFALAQTFLTISTAGPLPTMRLASTEFRTTENFAAPGLVTATGQNVNALSEGLTGVADLMAGPVGPSAPPPPFMVNDVETTAHLPQALIILNGALFNGLTAGGFSSNILVVPHPRTGV